MNNSNNKGYSRRNFIKKTALSVAGGITLQGGLPANAIGGERKFGFAAQPVLANVSPTKIEIIVAPNELATGWVEYGTAEELDSTVERTVDGRFQFSNRVLHFELNDLKPGSKYHYRVHLQRVVFHSKRRMERTEKVSSQLYNFYTLDPDGDTASFTCWNDTHEDKKTIKRLNELLDEQKPDFLVWNGDVTNDIFEEEQIVGQFLNPADQSYATSTPVMYSRGNHDVRGRDAPHLQDYMTGPNGEYHYGFRQGPMACLVMDTGEDKPDNHIEYGGLADFASYRSMQAEWLDQVIENSWFKTAPYRIAFMHIPLVWNRSSKYREWDGECVGWICEDAYNKWHDLLIKAEVQLVVSGHTHRHAYIPPIEGRPYGQLVGGGPQPERATCITGYANDKAMTITMTDLDQNILKEINFNKL